MKIPTLNIGDRQKGRVQSKSIINTKNDAKEISKNLKIALSDNFKNSVKNNVNPYDGGNSSKKIVSTILNLDLKKNLIRKKFVI